MSFSQTSENFPQIEGEKELENSNADAVCETLGLKDSQTDKNSRANSIPSSSSNKPQFGTVAPVEVDSKATEFGNIAHTMTPVSWVSPDAPSAQYMPVDPVQVSSGHAAEVSSDRSSVEVPPPPSVISDDEPNHSEAHVVSDAEPQTNDQEKDEDFTPAEGQNVESDSAWPAETQATIDTTTSGPQKDDDALSTLSSVSDDEPSPLPGEVETFGHRLRQSKPLHKVETVVLPNASGSVDLQDELIRVEVTKRLRDTKALQLVRDASGALVAAFKTVHLESLADLVTFLLSVLGGYAHVEMVMGFCSYETVRKLQDPVIVPAGVQIPLGGMSEDQAYGIAAAYATATFDYITKLTDNFVQNSDYFTSNQAKDQLAMMFDLTKSIQASNESLKIFGWPTEFDCNTSLKVDTLLDFATELSAFVWYMANTPCTNSIMVGPSGRDDRAVLSRGGDAVTYFKMFAKKQYVDLWGELVQKLNKMTPGIADRIVNVLLDVSGETDASRLTYQLQDKEYDYEVVHEYGELVEGADEEPPQDGLEEFGRVLTQNNKGINALIKHKDTILAADAQAEYDDLKAHFALFSVAELRQIRDVRERHRLADDASDDGKDQDADAAKATLFNGLTREQRDQLPLTDLMWYVSYTLRGDKAAVPEALYDEAVMRAVELNITMPTSSSSTVNHSTKEPMEFRKVSGRPRRRQPGQAPAIMPPLSNQVQVPASVSDASPADTTSSPMAAESPATILLGLHRVDGTLMAQHAMNHTQKAYYQLRKAMQSIPDGMSKRALVFLRGSDANAQQYQSGIASGRFVVRHVATNSFGIQHTQRYTFIKAFAWSWVSQTSSRSQKSLPVGTVKPKSAKMIETVEAALHYLAERPQFVTALRGLQNNEKDKDGLKVGSEMVVGPLCQLLVDLFCEMYSVTPAIRLAIVFPRPVESDLIKDTTSEVEITQAMFRGNDVYVKYTKSRLSSNGMKSILIMSDKFWHFHALCGNDVENLAPRPFHPYWRRHL